MKYKEHDELLHKRTLNNKSTLKCALYNNYIQLLNDAEMT